MKKIITIIGALVIVSFAAQAQVLLSGGLTYSQNFDTLTSTGGSSMGWNNNTTLLGWYGNRAYTGGTGGPLGSYAYSSYHYETGSANNGWIKSYGVAGVNSIDDRGFGSLSSGTPKTNAIAVRIQNDTASPVSLDSLAYTGEQWRIGQGNFSSVNKLYFGYRVSSSAIADPEPNVPWYDTTTWTPFAAADFTNVKMNTASTDPAVVLDGNDPANRIGISAAFSAVVLNPGDEIMLRWLDPDESGNDMGLAIDDLTLTFSAVPEPSTAVLAGLGLLAMALLRRRN
jgi:hypothetical protein